MVLDLVPAALSFPLVARGQKGCQRGDSNSLLAGRYGKTSDDSE
jgi:hypothetical protein